jgi:carbamoyltransferase
MRYCGISEFFHDAGIAFITEQGNIEFAAHSERYSKKKYDPKLSYHLLDMIKEDDHISFYEDHQIRLKNIPDTVYDDMDIYSNIMNFDNIVQHHVSHAALGYYTRPWESKEDTVMLTIDGAGEYQTFGIYDHKFNLLHEDIIPKSIGYYYTLTTKILGFKQLEEEYIVMGLASYGNPVVGEELCNFYDEVNEKFNGQIIERLEKKANLYEFLKSIYQNLPVKDIAASVQYFAEKKILEKAKLARQYGSKLIYSGGVAQNIVANSLIRPLFDDMWIPTAPNDSGSALGCAAYSYGQITGRDRINWEDPYLGYDIKRDINPKEVVNHLLNHTYCGIANGRAEFGPRALGNRSLIADVRYDVKDTVNEIKRRQKYRPFAPAILEEFADQYFEGPMNEYMQYTSKALHDYKSVIHVDGSARVQIVKKNCKSIIRPILEEYYEKTGVPMLLNTSLNIRGMPMVNDEKDAEAWEREYKVKVF